MIVFCGWIGAAALSAAPFIIDRPYGRVLAIIGLSLLTVQALDHSLYNLVALNTIGSIGYFWSLVK